MEQLSLRLLYWNSNGKPEKLVDYGNLKFVINDITNLIGGVDLINRTIAALPSTGVVFAGDLSGTSLTQTVIGLQGTPIAAAAPSPADVLTFDGIQWIGTAPAAGFITSIDNTGNDVILSAPGGVLSANLASVLISQFTNDAGYITSAGTPSLNATEIGFGSGVNLLTSSVSLTWNDAAKDLTVAGTISFLVQNSANVAYIAQGDAGYWFTGAASTGLLGHRGFGIDLKTTQKYTMGDAASGSGNGNFLEINDTTSAVKITTLAGAGGTVIASAAGVLSTIPTTSGTVTSVSGTVNRITSTGGATPVIDIAAAYDALWQPVNSNLTTIGGLAVARGAIMVGNSAPAWSVLSLSNAGKLLRSDGTDLKYGSFTIPDTFATNDLIYASAANTLTAITSANNGVLITSATGVPSIGTPANLMALIEEFTVIQSADLITTSTSMVDVTDMVFTVVANTNYIFEISGRVGESSTNGARWTIVTPASCTLEAQFVLMHTNGGSVQTPISASGTETATAGVLAITGYAFTMRGSVKVGATPGTVKLQARTINAANTLTQFAGTKLWAKKVL